MYIDKLDDEYNRMNEYNSADHRTIKMEPVDVKSRTYIDFNLDNNGKYL